MEGNHKMSERPTPETDAETMQDKYDHVDSDLGPFAPSDTVTAEFARKLERERDEAREFLRILAGLVAYGLGHSGEDWSLDAMRQATAAIQKAKALEGEK